MSELYLLDCTLRDGGYVNDWNFGYETIVRVLQKLSVSGVDYIECGYLSERGSGSADETRYDDLEAFFRVVVPGVDRGRLTLMIDYGRFPQEKLPAATADAPALRVCFHKKDMYAALQYCEALMAKGYTVFVQPMAAFDYTDEEFTALIAGVNAIKPRGFYIVDSFGVLELEDFQSILFFADRCLEAGILLGYHAHNNLQQAYGNAKYMAEQKLRHDIVIDASVYGMGRGAGNLNTELFAAYLNKNRGKCYEIDALLDIMDEHLKPIFVEHYWGYSLPFYLSAQYRCHPNYAVYYADKNTLSNRSMKELLSQLPPEVKLHYSVEEAERYYRNYQKKFYDDSETKKTLQAAFAGRELLILAPGKSIDAKRAEILRYIGEHRPLVIAVNVVPDGYDIGYLFCANEKRLKNLRVPESCRLLLSSNMEGDAAALKINYSSYLSENGDIADNPVLMLFRFLISIGIGKVTVAGFDGYSAVSEENYFDGRLSLGSSVALKLKRNELIRQELSALRGRLAVRFITPSKYVEEEPV